MLVRRPVGCETPAKGWTAFFVELTFPTGGKYPFKETTAIRVLPDTLPYAAPKPRYPTAQPSQPKIQQEKERKREYIF